MNFFRGSRRVAPPTVPTDTRIPFHHYDDSQHNNGLCWDLVFRFDDILDDEKLRVALSRLLGREGWRKLGARIRRNHAGALEYHVPQYYDSKRPGFAWSTDTFNIAVDEHPQASRLAQPHSLDTAGRPMALGVPSYTRAREFKNFVRCPGFPERLDDWLFSDSPQLGVHVIKFRDATLITLSFLHSFTDMMGLKAIMDAWTAVLRGEEDQVKPFVGFSDDALGGLGQMEMRQEVKYCFSDMLLRGRDWIWFAASYYFWIELFWPYREEERIVFLPAKHLSQMRQEVTEELANRAITIDGEKISFASEADVIFAWWTRIVMRAENSSPSRTICMRNTCCCRSLLEELGIIPSATSALVTNAVFPAFTFLKIRQVLDQSLACTAAAIRLALIQQRKADQLQALDAIRRHNPAIFGDANMLMFMMSNWEKSKLFSIDFSPAVVGQGLSLEKRNNQLGRPSCIQGNAIRHYALRNTGVVIGKDAGGNYWLAYSLRKEAWPAVERELLAMCGATSIM